MGRRRRYDEADSIRVLVFLLLLGIGGTIYKYRQTIQDLQYVVLIITLGLGAIFVALFIYLRKRNKQKSLDYDDEEKLMYMFRGMPPEAFEKEMASMFARLGYKAEAVGQSHDGGIDVAMTKDGEKYLVQCKKFITSAVTVENVRAFYGVITSHLAKKGFFITTNRFTPEAHKEFDGNPRIELVEGFKLVEYYRMSKK